MAGISRQLGGLDLGGQSPDSLSIAEYLKVLGNVSSRPAAPSGTVLKAGDSVSDQPDASKPPNEPELKAIFKGLASKGLKKTRAQEQAKAHPQANRVRAV